MTDFANEFISFLKLNQGKPKLIALGGGNTPKLYNDAIVKIIFETKNQSLLEDKYFTLTDERHVPLGHKDSNSSMLLETFIKPLGVESQFIYPEYSSKLEDFKEDFQGKILYHKFEKSLAILGVGVDGHTASLYPGKEIHSKDAVLTIDKGHDGHGRISLSEVELLKYEERWFIANSERKIYAIENSVMNDNSYEPISNLVFGNTTVFIENKL